MYYRISLKNVTFVAYKSRFSKNCSYGMWVLNIDVIIADNTVWKLSELELYHTVFTVA